MTDSQQETPSAKQYLVDTRYDSYESFFDHGWAQRMFTVAGGSNLERLVFNLCEGWKGAANTARLPWLLVDSIGQYADSFFGHANPFPLKVLEALHARLAASVAPPLSEQQRTSLVAAIGRLHGDIHAELTATKFSLDRHQVWAEMLPLSEFTLGVVVSQRLALSAIYYAYEDFVLNCFKQVSGIDPYRIGKRFRDDLAHTYSDALADDVWSGSKVRIPRLVRNALAHNGARETPELRLTSHGIAVVSGDLQIQPEDVRRAFDDLKVLAYRLLNDSVAKIASTP